MTSRLIFHIFIFIFIHKISFIYSKTIITELKNDTDIYKVFRVYPNTERELYALRLIWESALDLQLDFWKDPSRVGIASDIMVSPKFLDVFIQKLKDLKLNYTISIDNVEQFIKDKEHKQRDVNWENTLLADDSANFSTNLPKFDLFRYHTYDEMIDYMKALEENYPNMAQVFTLGETFEGRKIKSIKIGYPINATYKRAIWIDAGIHAREWASHSTAMYFIHYLLTSYEKDPEVKEYVNNFTWYITPNLNPDGYEYSRSSTRPEVRSWRKNRSLRPGCTHERCCSGVDLNRNFDFHWNERGASDSRCAHTYPGDKAFSENESKAVRDFVLEHKDELDAFITLHTYSQFWVYPFGHQFGTYPRDVRDLNIVARRATRALKAKYGTVYKVGSSADLLHYSASGGSDDWAKSKAGIKFVYLIELRPDEHVNVGFIFDEMYLAATGRETWEGIKVVADAVRIVNEIKARRRFTYFNGHGYGY